MRGRFAVLFFAAFSFFFAGFFFSTFLYCLFDAVWMPFVIHLSSPFQKRYNETKPKVRHVSNSNYMLMRLFSIIFKLKRKGKHHTCEADASLFRLKGVT